ncbi:MAG TPA: vWA domain-containing protein [Candidatus Binatia bacterium]|nr:vWA domain-containing protein [Candidatus Binatia bacterium]
MSRSLHLFPILLLSSCGPGIFGQQINECRSREAIVNVRDSGGAFVAGLLPSSFEANVGRQPLRVIAAKSEHPGPRVILMIDLSASQSTRLGLTRATGRYFVEKVSGTLRVAMISFSDRTLETVGFDHSTEDILGSISRIQKAMGRTSLYDSLVYAVNLFGQPEIGDAIFMIGDGEDSSSKSKWDAAKRLLASRGVRLFWFDSSGRSYSTPEERDGKDNLRNIVESSGGLIISTPEGTSAKDSRALEMAVDGVYTSIRDFYTLTLENAPGIDERKSWSLEVLDASGKKRDLRLLFSRSMPLCLNSATPQR